MSSTAHLFSQTDGTTNIDTLLTQEAYRISGEIYRNTLHQSIWTDLSMKKPFPNGQGYTISKLVYGRSLPNTSTNSSADASTVGLSWTNMATTMASAALTDSLGQNFAGAGETVLGPADARSYLHFTRSIKQASLGTANVVSPLIDVNDLRMSYEGTQQLAAIMETMTNAVRFSWDERYRDEYDRLCTNLVPCLTSGTPILTTVDTDNDGTADDSFEGAQTWEVDIDTSGASNADVTPTANISNRILDKIYARLTRAGAGFAAWGKENNRPVYGLVCHPDASYALRTETGFRDDLRKSSRVDELLAPLGVDGAFRGFYHLCDDLAPRFTISGGTITRVKPYTMTNGVLSDNASYDTAEYEAAYILHKEVMETYIPEPFSGFGAAKFDAVSHRGDFAWCNIPDAVLNPRKTNGFFHGILSSACLPLKNQFGFVLIYKRDAAPAA